MDLHKEFDRQVLNLLVKNYPHYSQIKPDKFIKEIEKLKFGLKMVKESMVDLDIGFLPFVIVVKSDIVSVAKAMKAVEKDGKSGVVKLFPQNPVSFKVIEEVKIPEVDFYLLLNIDRGKETLNISPREAIKVIKAKKRSPLTIDEGIAIITHYPEFLIKNNCFSLLASRNLKDKRVPAIWINSKKEPNLGWCWEGNPHTWLGSASCETRLA